MLDQNVSQLIRTTKTHLRKLEELGVITIRDLLLYFPRTHEDQTELQKIVALRTDQVNVVKGILSNMKVARSFKRGKILTQALLTDETGSIEVIWFNQAHLVRLFPAAQVSFPKGQEVILAGKLKFALGKMTLQNPKYELVHQNRFIRRV